MQTTLATSPVHCQGQQEGLGLCRQAQFGAQLQYPENRILDVDAYYLPTKLDIQIFNKTISIHINFKLRQDISFNQENSWSYTIEKVLMRKGKDLFLPLYIYYFNWSIENQPGYELFTLSPTIIWIIRPLDKQHI